MRLDRTLRALAHPITEYQVQKAKRRKRKVQPECEVCGLKRNILTGRGNDIHHRIPVHVRPDLATEPANLVTCCRTHHFVVGHLKNWLTWNGELDMTIAALRIAFEQSIDLKRKERARSD